MTKLVIFLKAPRAGSVKTRLAATMGAQAALAAYKRMTEDLLENLSGLSGVQIRFAPDDAEPELRDWLYSEERSQSLRTSAAPDSLEFCAQGEGDLGERLQRAFEENFARGFQRVVVIGSDCPKVTRTDIESAWAFLASCDVVIGPAKDGGYWLIGLRSAQPGLFDKIPWSTDRVLQATFDRIQAANLSYKSLRQLNDIDTEADWRRYREQVK